MLSCAPFDIRSFDDDGEIRACASGKIANDDNRDDDPAETGKFLTVAFILASLVAGIASETEILASSCTNCERDFVLHFANSFSRILVVDGRHLERMKLYNEKEIGAILKRAAEMSHDSPDSTAAGLSIEELQQVGSEAGLNPDLIMKAAAEIHSAKPIREKNFFGGPVQYSNEIMLDGEIDSALWEELLASIRGTFKDPGVVSTRENIFEWTSTSETEKGQVTAHVQNGRTKVTLFWHEPVAAIPFFVIPLIGTIISLPIVFEALDMSGFPGAAVIMSVAFTLFMVSRWGLGRYTDSFVEKLRRMETSFELIASKGEASRLKSKKVVSPPLESNEVTEHETTSGRLNLDDALGESQNNDSSERNRQRDR